MIENLQDELYQLEKKQAKGAKFDANMGQEVQGKKWSKTFLNLPSPSDRGQISIKLEAKYNESQQMLCRKKMPLLTGLEVSSLACKCVFYRREHNAKGGRDPMELNTEMKHTNGQSAQCRWKKQGHLSNYHVYYPSQDH